MQIPFSCQTLSDSDPIPFLNVVILYDDVRAGRRAMRLLTNSGQTLSGQVEFRPQLWCFDLLEDDEWFGQALSDASNAGVVIIAMSEPHNMSLTTENWIKACLKQMRETVTAIVPLFDGGATTNRFERSPLSFIRDGARSAGVKVLTPKLHGVEA